KELSLRFARSYGPGRYERSYEDWGVDYPAGAVRWTEGRNFEAVLDLLASGRLAVADLVTHNFDVARAPQAYELVAARAEPYLAIRFDYPEDPSDSVANAVAEVGRARALPDAGTIPAPRGSAPPGGGNRAGGTRAGGTRAGGTRVGWIGAGTFSG
nr:hypothetical protein [Micromonospora sp. DSM 115978]